jgi:hypothetical protein
MYPSNPGTRSFSPPNVWARQDGGFDGSRWMPGDFDGDGLGDVGAAWPNGFVGPGVQNGLAIRRSTGLGTMPFETTTQWAGLLQPVPGTAEVAWNPGGDGTWVDSSIWVSGDYDGDGRTDVAVVWNDGNAASISVYRAASHGARFEHSFPWSTRDGGFLDAPQVSWLSGDFNGDGLADLVGIWNDGGYNTFTTRLSNRSAFAPQGHWLQKSGIHFPNTKWLAGDFDGDGRTDIASASESGASAVFSIYRSTGTAFTLLYQGSPDGGWGDSVKMTVGDFDADGLSDIAAIWNDAGHNALVVRKSYGAGFLPAVSWMQPGIEYGGWMDSTAWIAGKFRR